MTFSTIEDLKSAGTNRKALERIAADSSATQVDEQFISAIARKTYPRSTVLYGLVYLEPPCPPISIHQFAGMLIGMKKQAEQPTIAPLPPHM